MAPPAECLDDLYRIGASLPGLGLERAARLASQPAARMDTSKVMGLAELSKRCAEVVCLAQSAGLAEALTSEKKKKIEEEEEDEEKGCCQR